MNWTFPLRLLGLTLSKRSRKHGDRGPRCAPALEQLEDRSVPSTSPVGSANFTALTRYPVATGDWKDTDGVTPVAIRVLANDIPGAGGHLLPGTLRVASAPLHGRASVNRTTGQITYKANAGFVGTDTFRYTVKDSLGGTSKQATVSVRVNRPTATDDWTDTDGTTPVVVDVLENDTDPEGKDHIEPALGRGAFVTLVRQGLHGRATRNADGSFTYRANAGFVGTDSFRYTVTDEGGGVSLPATAFVRVNAPTANDDLAAFFGPTPVTINVLENDTDPDGGGHLSTLSGAVVSAVSAPLHGRATLNFDGTFTYQPSAGFTGTDSFRYTVTDDAGATSKVATVTVVGFDGFGANDDFTDTDGSTPVAVRVLVNDFASGGGQLIIGTLAVTSAPRHGTVGVNRVTGAIVYTAFTGFTGTDSFQYSVAATTSPAGHTRVVLGGTASVRVNRPVAADDWTDTDGTHPVTIDVLENDQDPEGHQNIEPALHTGAAVNLVSRPAHGTVVRNANGSFTFTANAGFTGTDSFRYSVTDAHGATSPPATVFVRVNTPTASDDFGLAQGRHPLTIDVLENDQDPEGASHLVAGSVRIVTQPQHGRVAVTAGGEVIYTANAGWNGTDTFRYTVRDVGGATSKPAKVTVITLIPVVRNGVAVLGGGVHSTTFNVLAAAIDPLGAAFLNGAVVQITAAPRHGHLTIDPTTQLIRYDVNPGYKGTDKFSYTITDNAGNTSRVATITLSIVSASSSSQLAILDRKALSGLA